MSAPQVFYGNSKRAAGTAELRANLVFNYPVRPADVKARLRVTHDGKPVAVEINSAEPDQMVAFTFMQDVRPGSPIQIDIAPCLRPTTGTKATEKPLTAQAQVPDQSILGVREFTGSLLNGQPVVTVLLNQPISRCPGHRESDARRGLFGRSAGKRLHPTRRARSGQNPSNQPAGWHEWAVGRSAK